MFKSEDKIIEFTLERDVDVWDHCRKYLSGEWSFYKDNYYQANADVDPEDSTPDANSKWDDKGECAPVIDVDTELAGILIVLYQNPLQIVEKYSLKTGAGFQDITKDPSRTGVVFIEVTSAKTLTLIQEKQCKAEIKLLLNDSNFTGGVMNTIISEIVIDPVKDCVTKNITVPT